MNFYDEDRGSRNLYLGFIIDIEVGRSGLLDSSIRTWASCKPQPAVTLWARNMKLYRSEFRIEESSQGTPVALEAHRCWNFVTAVSLFSVMIFQVDSGCRHGLGEF
jgi:hypothetical protein